MKKFLWIIIILIIILLILWWLCQKGLLPFCKSEKEPAPWQTYIKPASGYVASDTTQQIIVWRTPGSDQFLSYWLDSIKKATRKNVEISVFCGTCDSNLMLLTGEGIKTFIQTGKGGTGGGTTCTNPPNPLCSGGGPSGGGDSIWWCVNFPVQLKDTANFDNTVFRASNNGINKPLRPAGNFADGVVGTHDTITVAVFDTGVDTLDNVVKTSLYKNGSPACLNSNANNGWNFPDKGNNVQDNYISTVGHGQVVTRIIQDEVNFYGQNHVKILPVKIHNANGESDLFSVLCGFSFAQNRGAKIINASFGYYALKRPGQTLINDAGAVLLKNYIKFYLTKNNILLIAAAGNGDTQTNDADEKKLYTNAGLPIPSNMRDLDQVNFYPASLSADPELPNVIAVTTAWNALDSVSPHQNFSNAIVDVGVNANLQANDDFWFRNTRAPFSYVRGTSYATPVVTGVICANYNKVQSFIPDKNKVLNVLLSDPTIGNSNKAHNKIKRGILFDNAH